MITVLSLWIALSLIEPTIILDSAVCHPVVDQASGEFTITGIRIEPPAVKDAKSIEITEVSAIMLHSIVKDQRTGHSYGVIVSQQPKKGADGLYEVTLRVAGGKFPLARGKVKGDVWVRITAKATVDGVVSTTATAERWFSFHN